MSITARGYHSEATLDGDMLTIRSTTKVGRVALFGPDPREELTIPVDQIASAHHREPPKWALMGVNGQLDLRTHDGTRYQLHYRAKKNADFGPLADAVVAAVEAAAAS